MVLQVYSIFCESHVIFMFSFAFVFTIHCRTRRNLRHIWSQMNSIKRGIICENTKRSRLNALLICLSYFQMKQRFLLGHKRVK